MRRTITIIDHGPGSMKKWNVYRFYVEDKNGRRSVSPDEAIELVMAFFYAAESEPDPEDKFRSLTNSERAAMEHGCDYREPRNAQVLEPLRTVINGISRGVGE